MKYIGKSIYKSSAFIVLIGVCEIAFGDPTSSEITMWAQKSAIEMPIDGIIVSLPTVGSKTTISLDTFNPSSLYNEYLEANFKHDANEDTFTFENIELGSTRKRLEEEFRDLRKSVEQVRSDVVGVNLARSPLIDPLAFRAKSPSDQSRMEEIAASIIAYIWKDSFIKTFKPSEDVAFPEQTLERKVRTSIDSKIISLIASNSRVLPEYVEQLAIKILTKRIRQSYGIVDTGLRNPAAPFQILRVNDHTIYSGHKISTSVNEFADIVNDYCENALKYWTAIESTGLYNGADFSALKAWGLKRDAIVTDGDFGVKVIPDKNPRSATERVKLECAEAHKVNMNVLLHKEILLQVADQMVTGGRDLEPAVLAFRAVERVAEGGNIKPAEKEKLVAGHLLDKERLAPILSEVWQLFIQTPFSAAEWPGEAPLRDSFYDSIATISTQLLAGLTYEYRYSLLMGGVQLTIPIWPSELLNRPKLADVHNDIESTLPFQVIGLIGEAIRSPSNSESVLNELNAWELAVKNAWDSAPGVAVSLKEYNEKISKYVRDRVSDLSRARKQSSRSHDIAAVLYGLNEVMGYSNLSLPRHHGRVRIPSDTVISSRHARVGEYARAQRPILTVEHRFRRNGRLFLTLDEMANMNIEEGSVFELRIDELNQEDGIEIIMIVHRTTPTDTDKWLIETEIIPVISTVTLIGNDEGIQKYTPVSDAHCHSKIQLRTSEFCDAAASMLPRYGKLNARLIEKNI